MNEAEVWRDIPGYIGFYQVSSWGRVKSLARTAKIHDGVRTVSERIMKQHQNNKGYMIVSLKKDGVSYKERVHRLVAMAFLGLDEDPDLVVDHINRNRADNRLKNLRVCTQEENMRNTVWTKELQEELWEARQAETKASEENARLREYLESTGLTHEEVCSIAAGQIPPMLWECLVTTSRSSGLKSSTSETQWPSRRTTLMNPKHLLWYTSETESPGSSPSISKTS